MRRKTRGKNILTKNALGDRRFIFICAVLIIAVLIAVITNKRLRPIGFDLAKAYGADAVISSINGSVSEFFDEEGVGYSDLVRLRFSPSGAVTAIEYNAEAINRIKIKCGERISKDLSKLRAAKVRVPLGSLFGDLSLSGRGPGITVKLSAKAVPDVELISKLDSAGVNQTRHEILMRVTADVSIYLPPRTENFSVSQDYVLAQTVIAGDVPQGNIMIE